MRFREDITRSLEVFDNASFAGNWDKQDAQTGDQDTARSRHGYIILYYGCPLIWKSQLQTEIALSSTESEYTGLSYALREAIPLMALLKELKEQGFQWTKQKHRFNVKYLRITVVRSKLQQTTNGIQEPSTLIVASTISGLTYCISFPFNISPQTNNQQIYYPKRWTRVHCTGIVPGYWVGRFVNHILVGRSSSRRSVQIFRNQKCCSDQSRPCGIKKSLFLHTFNHE